MEVHYVDDWACVIHGEALEALAELPDESIEALVTDPPAGVGFMNRDWDSFRRRHNPADIGRDSVFGSTSATSPHSYGESDRHRFVEWITPIFREVYRVLKPGAHGVVWSLPRTSHWTAWALEDAGFEIADNFAVLQLFGQGFPKSRNISKDIDRMAGAKREAVGPKPWKNQDIRRGSLVGGREHEQLMETAPATEEAACWEGFGTALKPAYEPWILIRKPIKERNIALNVLTHGTGAMNLGACEVGRDPGDVPGWHKTGAKGSNGYLGGSACPRCVGHGLLWLNDDGSLSALQGTKEEWQELLQSEHAKFLAGCPQCQGTGVLNSSTFRIRDMSSEEILDRRGDKGRHPPNLILLHTERCVQVGTHKVKGCPATVIQGGKDGGGYDVGSSDGTRRDVFQGYGDADGMEEVELWACIERCPVRTIDDQAGMSKSRKGKPRKSKKPGDGWGMQATGAEYNDAGGPSRFFPTFKSGKSPDVWACIQVIQQTIEDLRRLPGDSHIEGTENTQVSALARALPVSELLSSLADCPSCHHFYGERAREVQEGAPASAQRLADALEHALDLLRSRLHNQPSLLNALLTSLDGAPESSSGERSDLNKTGASGQPAQAASAESVSSTEGTEHVQPVDRERSDSTRASSNDALGIASETQTSCRIACIEKGIQVLTDCGLALASCYLSPNGDIEMVAQTECSAPRQHNPEEVWACVPGCPVREIDSQSGRTKSSNHRRHNTAEGHNTTASMQKASQEAWVTKGHADGGGASRYFPAFRYQPKPSRSEKEAGLESLEAATLNRVNPGGLEDEPRFAPIQVKCNHPTVKSIEFARWLIRLVCPPGGTILDCFLGSGSIGCAAGLEGMRFIGIEQGEPIGDDRYIRIALARMKHWKEQAERETA